MLPHSMGTRSVEHQVLSSEVSNSNSCQASSFNEEAGQVDGDKPRAHGLSEEAAALSSGQVLPS